MPAISIRPSYRELLEENRELRRQNFNLLVKSSISRKNMEKIQAAFYHVKVATVKAYDVMEEIEMPLDQVLDQINPAIENQTANNNVVVNLVQATAESGSTVNQTIVQQEPIPIISSVETTTVEHETTVQQTIIVETSNVPVNQVGEFNLKKKNLMNMKNERIFYFYNFFVFFFIDLNR